MCKQLLKVLALLFLYETQAQLCGCPVQQLIANPSQLVSQDLLTSQVIRPQVASTIVDNSVSNSLANALQLLIVSDLIASTLNPHATVSPCIQPPITTICESVPPPVIYSPTFDFIAPRTEFISPPCNPVVDVIRPRCSCIEPIPNYYGLTDVLPPVVNVAPMATVPNICGLQEIISPVPNFAQALGPPICFQELPGPVQLGPLSHNFCGGLADLIGPLANFGPIAELLYPTGTRESMACNVGYGPPSMPCANINMEPIPYTGVNYFY